MHDWPDTTDTAAIVLLFGVVVIAIFLGYAFMFVDLCAWVRACSKALSVVRDFFPHIPKWARQQTPGFLVTFGLRLPCTETELLQAYRDKVKNIHPDKGGDRKKFMRFQNDFEKALAFLRELNADTTIEQ